MLSSVLISAAERGLVPDVAVRAGIRRLLGRRLAEEGAGAPAQARKRERLAAMRSSAIALSTDAANDQHYEVPAAFFTRVLGPHMKYSAALWADGTESLEQAERDMLDLTVHRAGIRDGMRVLDLGCGWGSLSLHVARRFPSCAVTAVSNSGSQREFIEDRARREGLRNVHVLTADVADFRASGLYDRVVSVEMFEHVRNYDALLRRISQWLSEDGRLFVHVFCHRELLYFYEARGEDDWMARRFFSGGLMPSEDLLGSFPEVFRVEERWRVNGRHYAKTLRAWLRRLDDNRLEIRRLFDEVYGPGNATRWLHRWRMFLMACEELFDFNDGEEWFVTHYLLRPSAGEPR